jgi:hypothetical protein
MQQPRENDEPQGFLLKPGGESAVDEEHHIGG